MAKGPKEWLEITVDLPGGEEEAGLFLYELTGYGVVEEPGRVRGFCPAEKGRAGVLEGLAPLLAEREDACVSIRRIPDEDWASMWRSEFSPFQVSARLFICPPGERATPPAGCRVVEILPSRAFGTGTHPTTRMCLAALDGFLGENEGASVLDVGTGTGILAIGAAKLGAKRVLAIDVDPDVLEVALENVEKNGASGMVEVSGEDLASLDESFSLVVANLDYQTLSAHAASLADRVAAGGSLVVSGILEEQVEGVAAAISGLGLTAGEVLKEEVWAAAVFEKPPG